MRHGVPILDFERYPFFVGVLEDDQDRAFLPPHRPFRLYWDAATGLPRQRLDAETLAALELAYGAVSMGSTPIGEGTFGPGRAARVGQSLRRTFGLDVAGKRVLEVGCGTGRLLHELQKAGASVKGCELGPQGRAAADRYGYEVVATPLGRTAFAERFHWIYSYLLLEHVLKPVEFLVACAANLEAGGFFWSGVPNASPLLEAGDLGLLTHEHVSYFTARNLVRLLEGVGFVDVGWELSPRGEDLYVWGWWPGGESRLRGPGLGAPDGAEAADDLARLVRYARAVASNCRGLERFFARARAAGRRVGFYGGGWAYAGVLGESSAVCFFDGDEAKHGKRWLRHLSPIEPPSRLVSDPVDTVVVAVPHHFGAIEEFLRGDLRLPAAVEVRSLYDVFHDGN